MTTKTVLLQTIRKHCLECCGGSYKDVENCASGPDAKPYSTCALWTYRLGKDPDEPSESRKEQGRKLAASRAVKGKSHGIKLTKPTAHQLIQGHATNP